MASTVQPSTVTPDARVDDVGDTVSVPEGGNVPDGTARGEPQIVVKDGSCVGMDGGSVFADVSGNSDMPPLLPMRARAPGGVVVKDGAHVFSDRGSVAHVGGEKTEEGGESEDLEPLVMTMKLEAVEGGFRGLRDGAAKAAIKEQELTKLQEHNAALKAALLRRMWEIRGAEMTATSDST